MKFGKRPSDLLALDDAVIALDFDNAAAMRLQQWEDERNAAFFGSVGESPADVRFEVN